MWVEREMGSVTPYDREGQFVSALRHFLLLWKGGLTVMTSPISLSLHKDGSIVTSSVLSELGLF